MLHLSQRRPLQEKLARKKNQEEGDASVVLDGYDSSKVMVGDNTIGRKK